jgi:hypothetical protein
MIIVIISLFSNCSSDDSKLLLDQKDNSKWHEKPSSFRGNNVFITAGDNGFLLNLTLEGKKPGVIKYFKVTNGNFANTWTNRYNENLTASIYSKKDNTFIVKTFANYDSIFVLNTKNGHIKTKFKTLNSQNNLFITDTALLKIDVNHLAYINYLNNNTIWESQKKGLLKNLNRQKYLGAQQPQTIFYIESNKDSIYLTDMSLLNGKSTISKVLYLDNLHIKSSSLSFFWLDDYIGIINRNGDNSRFIKTSTTGSILWNKNLILGFTKKIYVLKNSYLIYHLNNGYKLTSISKENGDIHWEKDNDIGIVKPIINNNMIFVPYQNHITILDQFTGNTIKTLNFDNSITALGFYKEYLIFLSGGRVFYENYSKHLN